MKKFVMFVGLCVAECLLLGGLSGSSARLPRPRRTTPRAPPSRRPRPSRGTSSPAARRPSADTRTVTLNVSQTTNLQGRQEIGVSWSGAHPTGDIVPDPNSTEGEYEEYPFVLLECRGTASGADQVELRRPAGPRTRTPATRGVFPTSRTSSTSTRPIPGQPSSASHRRCRRLRVDPYCQADETGGNGAPVRYWVPWVAADGTVYDGGQAGFCGEPPEATDGQTAALPSNETYGVTGARRHRERRVRRVRLDAERHAWLLGQRRLLARRRSHHGHQLRRRRVAGAVGGRSRHVRGRRAPSAAGSQADGTPGDFPYNLTVSGRPLVEPVELAQPHQRPAHLRPDTEFVSDRQLEQRRRCLRFRAHAPGDEPVGALLLPGR